MAPKRYFDAAVERREGGSSSKEDGIKVSSEIGDSNGKNREPKQQTTLFVSSLPFNATSTDLETLFSDIGPLRRAFVVTDKDTGKSKGVGYVTFAILEDAQRAERDMQGKSLDGKRKIRIEWAEKKAFGGRKKFKAEDETDGKDLIMHEAGEEESTAPKATTSRVTTTRKPIEEKDKDAVRTIVITGLAACQPAADDKTIYKRARKIGDVDSVTYPAPLSIVSTSLSKDVAHVIYRTPNHAMTAVEKLHAHTFKGAQISVVLKRRADGAAKLEAHMRPETKDKREKIQRKIEEERQKALVVRELANENPIKGAEVNRGSRLIVRNLPFDVTDRDLRAVFLPYGPIYSIDVPQKVKPVLEDRKVDNVETIVDEMEGVVDGDSSSEEEDETESSDGEDQDGESSEESESEDDAGSSPATSEVERRDTRSNLGKGGRGFAFVWMVSRSDATKAIKGVNGVTIGRGAAERAQVRAAKGKAGREAAKKALEETLKSAQSARQVAVDWALSKKEWELKKDESENEETDKEEGEKEEEDQDKDSDLDPVEIKEGEDDSDKDEETKPALPTPSEQTTLFIRNLPYQATEAELRDVFRAFGPLRYAKVTMDKATNRSKGTGFVCFWQKESAENALRQAQLVEREVGSGANAIPTTASQKNPFTAQSVLTADPSAPLTSSLHLHGRVLSITLAVEKDTAETMSNKNRSAREKKDKRNTFLMREGVPLPGTPLAAKMSEKEIEKRLANFSLRKTQLSKNPSLFVSKTRLSVRQLPLYVSQKMLKRLGIYAVREFDAQVKRGERVDISQDDKEDSKQLLEEMHLSKSRSEVDDAGLSKKKFKKYIGERSTAVIQSKVMLQNDRIDSLTGLGRSRGYGFLEMRTYVDALKMVRFVNGEKSLTKLLIKWYANELEGMVKGLQRDVQEEAASSRSRDEQEELESRLKRVEKRLVQVKAGQVDVEEEGGRGGSIVVEFSIENVTVTKKRKERSDYSQGVENKRKRNRDDDEQPLQEGQYGRASNGKYETDGQRDKKTPRRENWNQKTTISSSKSSNSEAEKPKEAQAASSKFGSQMGSMIGRKRRGKKGRK